MLVAVCLVTDVRERKIRNLPVILAMLLGLLLGGLQGWCAETGTQGLLVRLGGLLCGFSAGAIFWWYGGIGAGDAKFIAAVGALTNMHFVVYLLAYSSLFGFALAVVYTTVKQNWYSLLNAKRMKRSERQEELRNPESARTIPFGIALCLGAVAGLWHYASRFGLPW